MFPNSVTLKIRVSCVILSIVFCKQRDLLTEYHPMHRFLSLLVALLGSPAMAVPAMNCGEMITYC